MDGMTSNLFNPNAMKIKFVEKTGSDNGKSRVSNDYAEIILARLDELLMNSKPYLTVNECARFLGVSAITVRRYIYAGVLKYSKPMGKTIFIARKDLDEFVEKGRVVSNAELSARASDYIASK